jgi:hypothetical protein
MPVRGMRQLRMTARRRVSFHLSRERARQSASGENGAGVRGTNPAHDDTMSRKGAHFIVAKR